MWNPRSLLVQTGLLLSVFHGVTGVTVDYEILSRLYLPYMYDPTPMYELDKGVAEQIAYDKEDKIIYCAGKSHKK